jgi:hypothetical protein
MSGLSFRRFVLSQCAAIQQPFQEYMAASLSQKIRELKDLADEGEFDGDDLEFIERVDELTGNGGAATLLSEAEAQRVDELYRSLGG